MQRRFPNILTNKVSKTARFYVELLGVDIKFSADWIVNLAHPKSSSIELGILRIDHEIVPAEAQTPPAGMMLTYVVDDCDAVHERAGALVAEIVEPPRIMPYGQKRMILKDPAGTLVDISSIAN